MNEFIPLINEPDVDNFLPIMLWGSLFVGLITTVVVAILVVFVLFILACLVLAGLVSSSVLVGFRGGSAKKGMRFFVISSTILCCNVVSLGIFWGLNEIYHWLEMGYAIMLGVLVGSVLGYFFGKFIFYAGANIVEFLVKKLNGFKNKL